MRGFVLDGDAAFNVSARADDIAGDDTTHACQQHAGSERHALSLELLCDGRITQANGSLRHSLVVGADALGGFQAEPLHPALHQPLGMRIKAAERAGILAGARNTHATFRGGHSRGRLCYLAVCREQGRTLAREVGNLAQHGIGKRGGGGFTAALYQFHALVDGSVRRNTLQ